MKSPGIVNHIIKIVTINQSVPRKEVFDKKKKSALCIQTLIYVNDISIP